MGRKIGQVLIQVSHGAPEGRTRCGHTAHTVGCRVCEAALSRKRRPGRLRGKGYTKSPARKPRRNRRRR